MKRQHATKAWAAWAVTGVALEVVALTRGEDGSTLSAHVWDLGRSPHRGAFNPKLSNACTVGFLGWVLVHFLSGGKL